MKVARPSKEFQAEMPKNSLFGMNFNLRKAVCSIEKKTLSVSGSCACQIATVFGIRDAVFFRRSIQAYLAARQVVG
jgi:hypothetical protein